MKTYKKGKILESIICQHAHNRCYQEILATIGSRKAKASDMSSLPYVQATITEIQRMGRVAPVSIPHKTTKPTIVEGFAIPEGSLFITNVSFIMNDPKFFKNPNQFDPSRFIDTHGRYL